ncbi:hypothetical protein [Thioalkalivibrio sp. ALE23]|uniref:hypothetical protein n=1 Tax=Thioalkalivibrio sp. ALE23 TaxID=1265495 RepID=UPI000368DC1E|nr:hypothetical protein [Thioalkalivibrio sp. ALE23]
MAETMESVLEAFDQSMWFIPLDNLTPDALWRHAEENEELSDADREVLQDHSVMMVGTPWENGAGVFGRLASHRLPVIERIRQDGVATIPSGIEIYQGRRSEEKVPTKRRQTVKVDAVHPGSLSNELELVQPMVEWSGSGGRIRRVELAVLEHAEVN